MFSACSSDDADDIVNPGKASREVTIELSTDGNNIQGTRAIEDGDDKYNENVISFVDLYFFTGEANPTSDSKIACTKEHLVPATFDQQGTGGKHRTTVQFKLSDSEVSNIFGTGSTCKVLVIANSNSVSNVTTYGGIMGTSITTSDFGNGDLVSNFIMTGIGTLTKDATGNISNDASNASIPMSRLAAKIHLRFQNPQGISSSDTWQIDTIEARILNLNSICTYNYNAAIPSLTSENPSIGLFDSSWHGTLKMEADGTAQGAAGYYAIKPIYSYPMNWLNATGSTPEVLAFARWKNSSDETRMVSYQFPLVINETVDRAPVAIDEIASNTSYIINIPLTVPTD